MTRGKLAIDRGSMTGADGEMLVEEVRQVVETGPVATAERVDIL